MTDEQIVKALRCWTGKTVKDVECAECSFGEDCTLGEIVDAAEKRINELAAENAALRERLEKAVELREPRITVDHWGGIYEVVYEKVQVVSEVYDTRSEAEARVAELKGEAK